MMKHRSTIAIFSEWQRLAASHDSSGGKLHLPKREAVEPRKLGRALSDLYFLEPNANGELTFRLAGTRICALFGRELKGTRLLSLWPERDRPALDELTQSVAALQVPALSLHDGISLSGRSITFEMFLAPLETSKTAGPCLLGSIAVLDNVAWLGADPIVLGHLNSVEPLAPDLVLAEETRQMTAITINALNRTGRWNETSITASPPRTPPKLTVINGGKA